MAKYRVKLNTGFSGVYREDEIELPDDLTEDEIEHEMTDEQHEELLKCITDSKAKVMISGYASDLYEQYLSSWNRIEIPTTARQGKKRTEVLWMNYKI
jgi:hypothetical protein